MLQELQEPRDISVVIKREKKGMDEEYGGDKNV